MTNKEREFDAVDEESHKIKGTEKLITKINGIKNKRSKKMNKIIYLIITIMLSNIISFAQSSPDSAKIRKYVLFEVNAYDEESGAPVSGMVTGFSGMYSYDINNSYTDISQFYNYDLDGFPASTDSLGVWRGSMTIPVYDKVTGVREDGKDVLSGVFGLGAFPNPYNPETNVSFSVVKPGRYLCQLVDADGSLIFDRSVDLLPGSYSVGVSSGAAGVDFFRVVGPDGGVKAVKLVNLGGGSSPRMGGVRSSGFSVGGSLDDVLSGGRLLGKVSDDPVVVLDSLAVGWGKSGYWGDFMKAIPLYGVNNGKDTVIIKSSASDLGFKFNVNVPGRDGVDTVTQYFNFGGTKEPPVFTDSSAFRGRVILYGGGDGSAVDSLKFYLPLLKR